MVMKGKEKFRAVFNLRNWEDGEGKETEDDGGKSGGKE
jgi:hypothetical protein